MPRHRKERVRKHWVPRRMENSARGVPVRAAVVATGTAVDARWPDDVATAETAPLRPVVPVQTMLPEEPVHSAMPVHSAVPAQAAVPVQVGPPDPAKDRPPANRPGMLRGSARNVLVTPWFAAGAGIVIAAAMWIYSPHAELKLPSGAVGEVPCQIQGCGPAAKYGAGSPSTTQGQRIVHRARSGRAATGKGEANRRDAVSGLKFEFTLLWQRHDSFGAMISVLGEHPLGSWRLTFTMPGAKIRYVVGAEWRPLASRDGGTASATRWHFDNHDGQHGASFVVFGSGTASTPATCEFDAAVCTFS